MKMRLQHGSIVVEVSKPIEDGGIVYVMIDDDKTGQHEVMHLVLSAPIAEALGALLVRRP